MSGHLPPIVSPCPNPEGLSLNPDVLSSTTPDPVGECTLEYFFIAFLEQYS